MAEQAIRLIAGLGNPGPEYDQTRHNAGFWFVDELARRHGGQFRREGKFAGEVCRLHLGGHEVWLLKPQTFMNRSGQSLKLMTTFYKIDLGEVLVAHDEIDLPPGTTRLKCGGGHGGHNGLRDIMAQLGRDFWRLRIGVGHPGSKEQVVDYVLGRPGREEDTLIRQDIDAAADLADRIIGGDIQKAMNQLHARA
ncbi:MAG: aminoacyl-tRNA hydrolase [Gammaproteobacteria bacterium]|nr:aminoacyl-tRNA hydrolase [Gammaproteobacteria bacterium]MDX5375657.1 aminoacyl-tRNA hydrolase [Gammaproteobacteria bacterium]